MEILSIFEVFFNVKVKEFHISAGYLFFACAQKHSKLCAGNVWKTDNF